MKRLLTATLLLLCLCGTALADGPLVVRLNDGASIPYLDGFDSYYLTDAEGVRGVTGAVEASMPVESRAVEGTLTVQNIALTDDVLAVFFHAEMDKPIDFQAGHTRSGANFAVPYARLAAGSEWLENVSVHSEGWATGENSLECMMLYTLPKPLAEGAVLTFGGIQNDSGGYTGGLELVIDRSGANDPTVAYRPMQEGTARYVNIFDGSVLETQFIVERIAFTPFGNRILINDRMVADWGSYNFSSLLDENGVQLSLFGGGGSFSELASKEHPMWIYHESWFRGGEDAAALTLLPWGYGEEHELVDTAVPLDSLPATVTLKNGAVVEVLGATLNDSGFDIPIRLLSGVNYWFRGFADAEGNALELDYEQGNSLNDYRTGAVHEQGSWTAEYEGRAVRMVTEGQVESIYSILVGYSQPEYVPLWDDAVTISLR